MAIRTVLPSQARPTGMLRAGWPQGQTVPTIPGRFLLTAVLLPATPAPAVALRSGGVGREAAWHLEPPWNLPEPGPPESPPNPAACKDVDPRRRGAGRAPSPSIGPPAQVGQASAGARGGHSGSRGPAIGSPRRVAKQLWERAAREPAPAGWSRALHLCSACGAAGRGARDGPRPAGWGQARPGARPQRLCGARRAGLGDRLQATPERPAPPAAPRDVVRRFAPPSRPAATCLHPLPAPLPARAWPPASPGPHPRWVQASFSPSSRSISAAPNADPIPFSLTTVAWRPVWTPSSPPVISQGGLGAWFSGPQFTKWLHGDGLGHCSDALVLDRNLAPEVPLLVSRQYRRKGTMEKLGNLPAVRAGVPPLSSCHHASLTAYRHSLLLLGDGNLSPKTLSSLIKVTEPIDRMAEGATHRMQGSPLAGER